jgi:SulP family sulfate permease
MVEMMRRLFPFLRWLDGYGREGLRADLLAGLTVALVLIPQTMAYAQLAGLPPYYGLYASFLPPLVAALFGSSRQLATGPVAVVSLMTAASLEPLATKGSDAYIAYAIVLAVVVGLFQLSLGILRLGLVVNFISHPVVNGFTNAAAIIIATSQLSKLFGVSVDTAEHHYLTVWNVILAATRYTHWPTLGMGVLAFACMFGLRRGWPKLPNVLIAVVLTTTLSWALSFERVRSLPIERVHWDRATKLIDSYGANGAEMAALAASRTEATNAVEAIRDGGDAERISDAQHVLDVTSIHLDQLKARAADDRRQLRGLSLDGVEESDGLLHLYQKGGVPAGAHSDGRTWRFRVGRQSLDPTGLSVKSGGEVVGNIPAGLPSIEMPELDTKVALRMLPYAAIIALLGFMEAISIAKAMAAKTGQRLDANQELIGQGLANIVGAFGKSYPASGSFSRSAVNLQAGAVSGFSSVFSCATVVIALLLFTPLLYHLPQCVLAAVIMMAVIGLVNVSGFVHAWKAQWYDGLISIITFIATLVFAPHLDKGIFIGISLSLMVFLYKSMRPTVASLSRHADRALRCKDTHQLQECPYIAAVRFDGPLFFANANYLEEKVLEITRSKPELRHVLLVANGISDVDASGEEALSLLISRLRSGDVDISLSGVTEAVMKVLARTHLREKIGEDHIYPTQNIALLAIHDDAHERVSDHDCPLLGAELSRDVV